VLSASNCWVCALPWIGPWSVKTAVVGSGPKEGASITSSSPQVGPHGWPCVGPLPTIQNAEQSPWPAGIQMRASMVPYMNEKLPIVLSSAEL
jgi:hypothetical protein